MMELTLDRAEILLEQRDYQFQPGVLYSRSGRISLLQEDPVAARIALYRAEALAEIADAGPQSELGRAITELQETLSDVRPVVTNPFGLGL